MDEILIEEKKYISSKRASEITGYAKDYIGQLCREGRVPARLVGRGWYVLETAIQDHRFGSSETEQKKVSDNAPEQAMSWESPRYEAVYDEILPSVNRLREESGEPMDNEKESDSTQNIQDSWREWFDRFGNKETSESVELEKHEEKKEIEKREDKKEEDAHINIPIHTIYRTLPSDLLPRHTAAHQVEHKETSKREQAVPKMKVKTNRTLIGVFQIAGIAIALITATTAVIGSGYLDEYVLSSSRASMIAGVMLYNR